MNALDILQTHNVKKTSPRIAIIKALQASFHPLSESDIKVYIGDQYDRITFYRNVQTLVEAGIIHKIVADNTTTKFALNNCDEGHKHDADHVHFYCNKCNLLVCLINVQTKKYDLPNGYENQQCNVIIKGLCIKCNN